MKQMSDKVTDDLIEMEESGLEIEEWEQYMLHEFDDESEMEW